jgi:hypothetical protein
VKKTRKKYQILLDMNFDPGIVRVRLVWVEVLFRSCISVTPLKKMDFYKVGAQANGARAVESRQTAGKRAA